MRTRQLLVTVFSLFITSAVWSQSVVDNNGTTYTPDDLSLGALKDATSITIKGTWELGDITTLHAAITNSNNLMYGDNAVLTTATFDADAVINNMDYLFKGCSALETVVLPTVKNNSPVSFSYAFNGCKALSSVIDLSSFGNISNLGFAFQNCNQLPEVILPEEINNAEVNMSSTFRSCSVLKKVDISRFTHITKMSYTFYGCSALATVILPADLSAVTTWTSIFKSCPENYKIFLKGSTVNLGSMPEDVKSHIIEAPVVRYTTADGSGEYASEELSIGCLKDATSITIKGTWEAAEITVLHAAITNSNNLVYGTNAVLTTATFDADAVINSMEYLFKGCSKLTSVTLPTKVNDSAVSFSYAFSGCSALTSPVDLSKFTTISNMGYAFQNCKLLTSVILPAGTTETEVNFGYAFSGCAELASAMDLRGFASVKSYASAFLNCAKLAEIRLGSTTVSSSIGHNNTFKGCVVACKVYLPNGVNEIPEKWVGSTVTFMVNGEPVGIKDSVVSNKNIPAISSVYTLDGKFVKNVPAEEYNSILNGLERGVYIVNGEKVIVM